MGVLLVAILFLAPHSPLVSEAHANIVLVAKKKAPTKAKKKVASKHAAKADKKKKSAKKHAARTPEKKAVPKHAARALEKMAAPPKKLAKRSVGGRRSPASVPAAAMPWARYLLLFFGFLGAGGGAAVSLVRRKDRSEPAHPTPSDVTHRYFEHLPPVRRRYWKLSVDEGREAGFALWENSSAPIGRYRLAIAPRNRKIPPKYWSFDEVRFSNSRRVPLQWFGKGFWIFMSGEVVDEDLRGRSIAKFQSGFRGIDGTIEIEGRKYVLRMRRSFFSKQPGFLDLYSADGERPWVARVSSTRRFGHRYLITMREDVPELAVLVAFGAYERFT